MKTRFKLYYIIIIWYLGAGLLSAQEPSYRIVGEEELSGVDIYSMFQDTAHNIWLGTSQSLIRYDGYEFKFFSNVAQKRKSLFGLTTNKSAALFCFNLSGQIFKVAQDSLYLYYELPDTLVSNIIDIFFDKKDNLVISARQLLLLNQNLELTKLGKPETTLISQNAERTIIGHYISDDTAFVWDGQQLDFYCILPNTIARFDLVFFPIGVDWFSFDKNSAILCKARSDTLLVPISQYTTFERSNSYRASLGDKILYADLNSGGWLSNTKGDLLYTRKKILKSYRIGQALLDKENSVWIGTIGKGLLFIPNLQVTTHKYPKEKEGEVFTALTYDLAGKLYIGSSLGQIYRLEQNADLTPFLKTTLPILFLKYIPETKELFTNTGTAGNLINILSNTIYPYVFSSIKDISLINKTTQTHLVSSSSGTYKYNLQTQSTNLFTNLRSNCVYYDKYLQLGWAGTNNGLFSIKNGVSKKFDPVIIAQSIVGNEQGTWVGSTSEGIVQLKNEKVIYKLTIKEGLHSNNIKKLVLKNNLLYIGHDKGIQIYNIVDKSIQTINTTDGLLSNNIIDFDVYKQELSVITNKGLQQIQLNTLQPNLTVPYLELTNILVNDSIWSKAVHNLNYDQNQITFQFKAKAYRHQNSLNYFYKLDKVDKDWVKTSYTNNQAKYPFLPAGKYTFRVKAVNEDGVSSSTVTYSFCIHPPFWQTWWFYLLLSGSLVALVSWYYRIRAQKQRLDHRQKQELLSSKLTALKSQMNPHFIFNALNSIQALIVTEQLEDAYTYIVKFSNLVRNTLNYSDKDMLDIEDEIQLLELYLELEKLRFRKDFEYSITQNSIEGIKIPPMLIQPFVENAIKHGLLHKKGYKSISITFEKKEALICTIVDNGIGRKQAQAIKDRQAKAHESFSIQSTNTRFKILQEIYMGDLGIRYEDLQENGGSKGTKVVLTIPFEQVY